MTDILGHDVNGRPLRAGDRVQMVGTTPRFLGDVHAVIGPMPDSLKYGVSLTGIIPQELIQVDDGMVVRTKHVRRLDDRTDHQPSEYTYDELLDSLKTGAPNHAKA